MSSHEAAKPSWKRAFLSAAAFCDRVLQGVRKLTAALRENPVLTRSRWVKRPGDLANCDVCLFVTYNRTGRIADHALFHAHAWRKQGFKVILIVSLDCLDAFDDTQDLTAFAGVLARRNVGYDFGAWAATIRKLKNLRSARLLATANDSVYGPLASFATMIEKVRASTADVIGATESLERRRHLQSYLLFFKPTALRSKLFWRFWGSVRNGVRSAVIERYELTLAGTMQSAGLRVEALFRPSHDSMSNPTLTGWRDLVESGFPYLKAQLLRDNPCAVDLTGWQTVAARGGVDPAMIEAHLRETRWP